MHISSSEPLDISDSRPVSPNPDKAEEIKALTLIDRMVSVMTIYHQPYRRALKRWAKVGVKTGMGAIAFSRKPEHSVVYAGWVLRQVMDDTASQHPEDSEMAEEFESAKAIDGLMVYLLRPELAARITAAIRETATGILSGNVHSGVAERHHGDERTITQYRQALQELLGAIPPPSSEPLQRESRQKHL